MDTLTLEELEKLATASAVLAVGQLAVGCSCDPCDAPDGCFGDDDSSGKCLCDND